MTSLDSFERALNAITDVERIDCPACEDGTITIRYKEGTVESGPCPVCDGTQKAPDHSKMKEVFMREIK